MGYFQANAGYFEPSMSYLGAEWPAILGYLAACGSGVGGGSRGPDRTSDRGVMPQGLSDIGSIVENGPGCLLWFGGCKYALFGQ